MNNAELADLLIPDTGLSLEEIIEMYPKRNLQEGVKVTRVAPSPTGYLHMGGLYAARISERLAHQSGGVFYLRIEDTDGKREVKGSISDIISSFEYFGLHFDEGEIRPGIETGGYGPYKQSSRRSIYRAFVKELIKNGKAYPCFCSAGELESVRSRQKAEKQLTGYYGGWAACRNLTAADIQRNIACGAPFVIRLKSPGKPDARIELTDLVKRRISFPENIQDIVILKTDGLPTYHFAHAVDDHLMGTTHVFRGDEWLSSVPIHLQLFETLGWDPPHYGHIASLMKMEGDTKRKLSKRKDHEAAAGWYRQQGIPGSAVTEYLLGLANSNYEEWRAENPHVPNESFMLSVEKLSGSGALFDIKKFSDVCRNVIAGMSADEVYNALAGWSAHYDHKFYSLIAEQRDYTIRILSIGRGSDKPRKDIMNWSEVKPLISYFYDELYDGGLHAGCLPAAVSPSDASQIISIFTQRYDEKDDADFWFGKIKELCGRLGYAGDMKSFRKDPSAYKGHVGDVAMVLRVALTGRTSTPDLYEIMQVMGRDRVIKRLDRQTVRAKAEASGTEDSPRRPAGRRDGNG